MPGLSSNLKLPTAANLLEFFSDPEGNLSRRGIPLLGGRTDATHRQGILCAVAGNVI